MSAPLRRSEKGAFLTTGLLYSTAARLWVWDEEKQKIVQKEACDLSCESWST